MASNAVNHPDHYGGGDNPFEVIKVIERAGMGYDFCIGNAVKYIARAGKKDSDKQIEDLQKAAWYIRRAESQYSPARSKILLSEIEVQQVAEAWGLECNFANILDLVLRPTYTHALQNAHNDLISETRYIQTGIRPRG
jgi:hypothetical protein